MHQAAWAKRIRARMLLKGSESSSGTGSISKARLIGSIAALRGWKRGTQNCSDETRQSSSRCASASPDFETVVGPPVGAHLVEFRVLSSCAPYAFYVDSGAFCRGGTQSGTQDPAGLLYGRAATAGRDAILCGRSMAAIRDSQGRFLRGTGTNGSPMISSSGTTIARSTAPRDTRIDMCGR